MMCVQQIFEVDKSALCRRGAVYLLGALLDGAGTKMLEVIFRRSFCRVERLFDLI